MLDIALKALPAALSRSLSSAGFARMLKLFSAAVIDQVLLSGSSFAVGLLLIRFTSDHDYGLYVLVLSAQQLLTSLQRSSLTGPVAIVSARRSPEARRANVGAARAIQGRVLTWLVPAALLVLLVVLGLGMITLAEAVLLVIAVLSCWLTLRRELLRDVLLMYSRPHSLLAADAIFVALLVAGVLLAAFLRTAAILWVMATLCLAALAGALVAERMLSSNPGWERGAARPLLREIVPLGFWATVGALTYWVYSQSFNYLLAGRVNVNAVAAVNATRLMLMPPMVLTIGVQALLMPIAPRWFAEGGLSRLLRRLSQIILVMAVVDVTYLAVMWLSRDWLTGTLLRKEISARDLLLALWALVALIGVVRDVMQCALFALGRMKSMAAQGIVCATVAVVLTWFSIGWWGAPAVVIGQIVAELVNLAGIGRLLRRALRDGQPVPQTLLPP